MPEYGGTKITLHDGEYSIFRDNEVVGILHK